MISTVDSTMRPSQRGRPYSITQTAVTTPIGTAIRSPIAPSRTVPSIASRKPPDPDWLTDALGCVTSRLGRRYWMPSTAKNTTTDMATAHRPSPTVHANTKVI